MSTDPKTPGGNPPAVGPREKGLKIFTYPKIIFMFPTLIMSLVCWVGMWMISEKDKPTAANTTVQAQDGKVVQGDGSVVAAKDVTIPSADPIPTGTANPTRFRDPRNVLGLIFLGVLFFNLMILAIDFPRFTIFALILLGTTVLFFLLWLGVFVNILEPLERAFQRVYVFANAQFYFIFALLPIHMVHDLQMDLKIKIALVPILGMACMYGYLLLHTTPA